MDDTDSAFRTLGGIEVPLFVLEGEGIRASVSAYGAHLLALEVPDREGERANVVLGFASLDAYRTGTTYFGAAIGRYANRIARGRFTLDGTAYQLSCNDAPNTLHGGSYGFNLATFAVVRSDANAVTLRHVSPAGDQGFPGCLRLDVTYAVEANALRVAYEATTDAPTVLNVTNHSYFNLEGEASGCVYDHELQIDAERYLPIDATSIPLGELRDVAGTPFDFRTPHAIGERIRAADDQLANADGYDHNWVLSPPRTSGDVRRCARVRAPRSGRLIECETDQPGLQFYTANKLTGALRGRHGNLYRQGDAFTLETQGFLEAPNQPSFPSTVLRPSETFCSETVFRFSAR